MSQQLSAMEMAGIDPAKIAALKAAATHTTMEATGATNRGEDKFESVTSLDDSTNIMDAAKKAGIVLSADELSKVFNDKIYLNMNPTDIIKMAQEAPTLSTAVASSTPGMAVPLGGPPKKDEAPMSQQQGSDLQGEVEGVQKALRKDGIKMDGTFLKSQYGPVVQTNMLDALRTALFEQKMYSEMTNADILTRMKDEGLSSSNAGTAITAKAMEDAGVAGANATGGTVMGVGSDGLASVARPAPGEMFASVGKGETILPKGKSGSGSTIQPVFNITGSQEFTSFMQNGVNQLIQNYHRRTKSQ